MPLELVTKQEVMNVTSIESITVVENQLVESDVKVVKYQLLPVSQCNNKDHDILKYVPVTETVRGFVITPVNINKTVPVTRQQVVPVTKEEFVPRPVFRNINDCYGNTVDTVFCGYC